MTNDDRIDRLETRVDRLETSIDAKLDKIFNQLSLLAVESASSKCPSPGACVSLSKDLAHAVKILDANTLRVERLELKILDVEKHVISEFSKIERQKAWVLGVWSAVAFFSSILGGVITVLLTYYLKK